MKDNTYAVVDIGSNSLRLMQGWCDKNGHWHFSKKKLASTRLGRQAEETGRLSREGMEASFAVMERWQRELQGIPVCAVATSAVREAADGQAFMAEVRARFGWHCRIISGWEEGDYNFRGAASAVPADLSAAVLDIGGGSSELSVGRHGQSVWSHSYPLGAVRCTDRIQRGTDYQTLEDDCLNQWLPLPCQPDILIGTGGTLTSLAAMELGLEIYDPEQVEGTRITLECLSQWIRKLSRLSPEQRRQVRGLQPERGDIILAGLVIARSCLNYYQMTSLTVSERDLMEGIFYDKAFQDAAWAVQ